MTRDCRSSSSGCARPGRTRLFSLTARPGHLRLYGRETIGSQFRSGAGRAAAAVALLQRRDHRRRQRRSTFSRRPGSSATTTARSFIISMSRTTNASGQHLRVMSVPAGPGPIRRVHAADSDRRRMARVHLRVEVDCERSAVWVSAGRRADWHLASAAVRREHPVGRGDRARPPELHRRVRRDVAARIWRERGCRPTSTTSSTKSARSCATRASDRRASGEAPQRRYAFTFASVSFSARADCCTPATSFGQSLISTCFSTPPRPTTTGTLRQMSRMP